VLFDWALPACLRCVCVHEGKQPALGLIAHSRQQAAPMCVPNTHAMCMACTHRFVRRELVEISPTEDAGLARGAMRIIEACLDDFRAGGLGRGAH
jgi:hypothetical protein